jgi:hypothetical protein
MHGLRCWMVVGMMGALAAGACSMADASDDEREPAARRASVEAPPAAPPPPPPPPAPTTAADSARVLALINARGDSVRAAFASAKPLGAREVAELRQDVNAEQIASARELGVRAGNRTDALKRQGVLVELDDSTELWVLRDMDHSVPVVTPDARAMLMEIGRRFHARLDSLGLPRYRMKVTSALRTDETQAELRRINPYASQTVSAHEFGTTMDVSHERFAIPADPPRTGVPEMEEEMLDSIGKEHAKVLQAELGRAIAQMRDEGALHVMMENLQPVYHMTVRRRFTSGSAPR